MYIFFTLALACAVVSPSGLSAADKTVVLGGKSGWGDLSLSRGICKGEGRFGYESIELASNARALNEYTDLLIDFENGRIADSAGNYSVVSSLALQSSRAVMGKGAALVQGAGGLSLKGKPQSLFGTSGAAGSFTLEFWLKPAIAENGEVVFSWRSSRTINNYPMYQMIIASILNNRLEWKFTNVFSGWTGAGGEVTLMSDSIIIPDKWGHHSISFDEETGLFEYRIDSRLEDAVYVTSTGKERGEVFQPVLGIAAHFEICPNFSGSIDDIRFLRRPFESVKETQYTAKPAGGHYDVFNPDGGCFVSPPITAAHGSALVTLNAVASQPRETAVQFFVRAGDNLFDWTADSPAWIPMEKGKPIYPARGRYFQVAANLYPDGAGSVTPSVTEITLVIREGEPPLPPFSVRAEAGDGCVTLSWPVSIDENAGGYYVFYGERPGEYLGAAAVEGRSPVDAGRRTSYRLTGLINGKVYYFSVAAYSDYDSSVIGELSTEVHARPFVGRR
jgi:hypothetical protein